MMRYVACRLSRRAAPLLSPARASDGCRGTCCRRGAQTADASRRRGINQQTPLVAGAGGRSSSAIVGCGRRLIQPDPAGVAAGAREPRPEWARRPDRADGSPGTDGAATRSGFGLPGEATDAAALPRSVPAASPTPARRDRVVSLRVRGAGGAGGAGGRG